MTSTALVVCGDESLLGAIVKLLRSDMKLAAAIDSARSVEQAQTMIAEGDYDCAIVHADTPQYMERARGAIARAGVVLVSSLAEMGNAVATILITSSPEPDILSFMLDYPNTRLVCEGLGFANDLIKAVRSLARPVTTVAERYLNVIISLDEERKSWTYQLKGEGCEYFRPGVLEIDERQLKELARRSQQLYELIRISQQTGVGDETWEGELRSIGVAVMKHIFLSDVSFYGEFRGALSKTVDDRIERCKIWFCITGQLHPIILEAIVPDGLEEKFWMLRAPIYRRLQEYTSTRAPLFLCQAHERPKKLNCLIVEADTEGAVAGLSSPDGKPLVLKPLPYVAHEANEIEKFLKDNRAAFGLGKVERIRKCSIGNNSFRRVLEQRLREDEWHLLHYVGHSLYDSRQGGYIFLPGLDDDGGAPEKIEMGTLAPNLQHTRFLYLSSCSSSQVGFTAPLARCNVPAAVGFHWQVNDQQAAEYAIAFYDKLFSDKDRCLQHAVLKARQRVYEQYGRALIWASPVLMVQSG